ncbi:MAG: mazG, partial [Rhodospirillaceae bacterium]
MTQDHGIGRLLDIMARLRDPVGGCPWDVEQTFASIVPHTIEEVYEVVDAIEKGDMALLKEELGDLLLQVLFYAQMAQEEGLFTFADIATVLADKLVRRHPHVFGDMKVDSAEMQLAVWEALKADERRRQDMQERPSVL